MKLNIQTGGAVELADATFGADFNEPLVHQVLTAFQAAARAGTKGRVIALVEPHRYTRVQALFADFSACFKDADSVIVWPLYSAGEAPIDGISQHSLAEGIRRSGHAAVTSVDDSRDVVALLRRYGKPGDMIVCFGAGHSTEWATNLPMWLSETEQRRA